MRQLFVFMLLVGFLPTVLPEAFSQSDEGHYIVWTGENESANSYVEAGIWYMLNWENDKAVTMFQAALYQDPSLFAAHAVLANLLDGSFAEQHKAKAQELVAGHNEVSNLFVSLLDLEQNDMAGASLVWAEMREKASEDANLVHFFYALTRSDIADQKAELESLLSKIEASEGNPAYVHNILGYIEMQSGNMEAARTHFDKYIELYPNGYNPYDSMGEYYLNAGDLEKSMEMYQMATDIHPGARNAVNKLEEIEAMMAGQHGRYILVNTDYVNPSHFDDYWTWGMEFKAAAEEDGFSTIWVNTGPNNSFSYAADAGSTMAEVTEYKATWWKWGMTDKLKSMYEAYKHSVIYSTEQLWWQNYELSYIPEDYEWPDHMGYVRAFKGYIKFGHEEQVEALMAEMVQLATDNGISHPWQFYWNVYGEEGPCMGLRMMYPDRQAWADSENEMQEKIGEEKMMEMNMALGEHMRYFEESESLPLEYLTHIQEENP